MTLSFQKVTRQAAGKKAGDATLRLNDSRSIWGRSSEEIFVSLEPWNPPGLFSLVFAMFFFSRVATEGKIFS